MARLLPSRPRTRQAATRASSGAVAATFAERSMRDLLVRVLAPPNDLMAIDELACAHGALHSQRAPVVARWASRRRSARILGLRPDGRAVADRGFSIACGAGRRLSECRVDQVAPEVEEPCAGGAR